MKLDFSPQAEHDAEAIDLWWRQHRADAPRLFAEELKSVCEAIERKPTIVKPYATRGGVLIRRWLLEETGQHVYYSVEVEYPFRQPRRDAAWGAGASWGAWTSQCRSERAWSARSGRNESSAGVIAG